MGCTLLSLIVRLVEFIILIAGLLKTFIMLKLGEMLTEQLNMLIQLFSLNQNKSKPGKLA